MKWSKFRFLIHHCVASAMFVLPALGTGAGQTPVDGGAARFVEPNPVTRLALVIGAQHYHVDRGVDPVPNALNDAKAIAEVLAKANFSFIRYVPDPDSADEIQDYISELVLRAGRSEDPVVIVFFFAGHGFQNEAFNYIVPAGARSDHALEDSFPVINIVSALASHKNSIAIMFFDSCRTGIAQTDPTVSATVIRSVGFAPLPSVYGADLGLAASYGFPAKSAVKDGDSNSPYTTALLEYLSRQAMSLDTVFSQVQRTVMRRTQSQVPFEVKGAYDSGFFFRPTKGQQDEDGLAWESVLKTNRPDCVQAFIDTHPGGVYVKGALTWLAELDHLGSIGEGPCPVE